MTNDTPTNMKEEKSKMERLVLKMLRKDGRVEAVNYWDHGYDILIYSSLDSFNKAKIEVEEQQKVPRVSGYTAL